MQVQTLAFSERAAAKLQLVLASYLKAAIYLSGALTIDFPDEVVIVSVPSNM